MDNSAKKVKFFEGMNKSESIADSDAFMLGKMSGDKLVEYVEASQVKEYLGVDEKVDKIDGKSLVDDGLIEKLNDLQSQEDINLEIEGKVDKEEGKSLISDDLIEKIDESYSKDEYDNLLTDITTEVLNKVDKVDGKTLISNEQLEKLDELDTKENLDTQLSDIKNSVNDVKSVTDTIVNIIDHLVGVTTLTAGNGNIGTNRTRVDNSFPIVSTNGNSVVLNKINIYVNQIGSGKIKFLKKTDTVGKYIVYKELSLTFTETGIQTIDKSVFGENYILDNNTYLGFYCQNASYAVALGATGASFQGNVDLNDGHTISINSAIIQFNVDYTENLDRITSLQNKVNQLEDVTKTSNPDMFYKYDLTGNGTNKGLLSVYCKLYKDKYLLHTVGRETDLGDEKYVDYYRYLGCSLVTYVNGNFTNPLVILTSQESEFVWQQVGKGDFTGGYHGDELMTSINFYVDGQMLNIGVNTPLSEVKSVYYVEKSTMHETGVKEGEILIPVVGHPIIANHTKITEFTTSGYKTKNLCNWVSSITLSQYYSGISCVGRNVAKKAYTDKDYILRDLDDENNALLGGVGCREYNVYNETNKLAMKCTSRVITGGTNFVDSEQVLNVRDNGLPLQYKKYYRGIPSTIVTVVGETWVTEMIGEFKYKIS